MAEVLDGPVATEEEAAQRVIQVIGIAPKAIKTEEDYEQGMQWLGGIVKRRKLVEAFFESIKMPLRKALNEIRTKEDTILAPLVEEQNKLKTMTGDYFMKRKREQDAKQALENAKHEAKVEKAIEAGKDPESIAPPKVVNQLAKTVKSEDGPTATMRLIKQWRVTKLPAINQGKEGKTYRNDAPELQEIPDACWALDTVRANAVAKSGMSPALELYEIPSQSFSG